MLIVDRFYKDFTHLMVGCKRQQLISSSSPILVSPLNGPLPINTTTNSAKNNVTLTQKCPTILQLDLQPLLLVIRNSSRF